MWRQAAENVAESLHRGMRVIVTGRLKQRSYETKEGEKRTVYELEVDEVGPSLRNASAKVTKATRTGAARGRAAGQRQGRGPVGGEGLPAATRTNLRSRRGRESTRSGSDAGRVLCGVANSGPALLAGQLLGLGVEPGRDSAVAPAAIRLARRATTSNSGLAGFRELKSLQSAPFLAGDVPPTTDIAVLLVKRGS